MVLDKFSLAGQVGIVTGGGRGLGWAFCEAFAEAGADIVIAEITPETVPLEHPVTLAPDGCDIWHE